MIARLVDLVYRGLDRLAARVWPDPPIDEDGQR